MKHFALCLTMGALLVAPATLWAQDASTPIPVIFDTDIGNDVDDVLALGMIHALQDRGVCELKAVTITKDHPECAAFVDAVNTFYGRDSIPIGVVRDGVTPHQSRFTELANTKDDGKLRYPHDLASGEEAPAATTLLRQVLADAEDSSVAVVQVGFSTNLARLLDTRADEISPLSGKELVKQKVKVLSIMAGAFEQIPGRNGRLYDHLEYNIIKDIPACQTLATRWPTPIVWSGYEIGLSIPYPHESIEQDYQYVEHHPLSEAYVLYNPPPHNRPTWDLTSVLYAVYPDRGYFDLSTPGIVRVRDNGLTVFEPTEKGTHRYLIVNDVQRARVVEACVQLSSQPPQRQTKVDAKKGE